jgi:hypothetical protein
MPDDEGHPAVPELEAHQAALDKIIDEAIGMRAAIEAQLRALRHDVHTAGSKRSAATSFKRRR